MYSINPISTSSLPHLSSPISVSSQRAHIKIHFQFIYSSRNHHILLLLYLEMQGSTIGRERSRSPEKRPCLKCHTRGYRINQYTCNCRETIGPKYRWHCNTWDCKLKVYEVNKECGRAECDKSIAQTFFTRTDYPTSLYDR